MISESSLIIWTSEGYNYYLCMITHKVCVGDESSVVVGLSPLLLLQVLALGTVCSEIILVLNK